MILPNPTQPKNPDKISIQSMDRIDSFFYIDILHPVKYLYLLDQLSLHNQPI